jgi:hypothetical protein
VKIGIFDHVQKHDRPERAQWCPPKPKLVRELFDYYREVYRQINPTGSRPRFGFERQIYVAESDKKAVDEAKDHWVYF